MKTVNKLLTIFVLIIFVLLSACQNPFGFLETEEAESEGGTFLLKYVIPDYDHDLSVESDGTRVISPNTYELRVYLDGKEFMTIVPTPAVDNTLEAQTGPVVWTGQINGVPAATYGMVTIEQLDSSGNILTSGSAFNVEVEYNEIVDLSISCLVAQDAYEFLTVGGEEFTGSTADSEMVFYKFYGRKDTDYTLSISATTGTPDMYLFDPTGAHTGNFDYGSDGYQDIVYSSTMNGTYAIGVYGWNGAADYSISVTSSVTDPAQTHVDLAFGAMRDMDWDTAISEFSSALLLNPAHPDAIMGYSLVSMARIFIDPDMVDMAKNKLGLVEYPSTINELFSSDWLSGYVMAFSGNTESNIFIPNIVGQEAWDGFSSSPDGIIDPNETLMAMVAYFASHNTGFDDIMGTLTGVLGDRLNYSVAALDQVLDGTELTLTWDMLFDTYDQATWPMANSDDGDEYLEITLGKAELQTMASFLQIIKTMAYLVGAYDFDLVQADGTNLVEEYWTYFNPEDGTYIDDGTFPIDTPFSIADLLKPSDRAATYLVEARASMLDGLGRLQSSFTLFSDRDSTSPYNLDDMILDQVDDEVEDKWIVIQKICDFMVRDIQGVIDSIVNNQSAFIVIPNPSEFLSDVLFLDQFLDSNDWPNTTRLDDSLYRVIEINLAPLFLSTQSIPLELAPNGEPVWYILDNAVMRPLTIFEQSQVDPSSADLYYTKLEDMTFQGLTPISNYLLDDPETLIRMTFSWNDNYYSDERAGNGFWDLGETIWSCDYYNNIEGPFDLDDMASYPDSDPIAFYDVSGWEDSEFISYLSDFDTTDSVHPLDEFLSNTDDRASLITDIEAYFEWNSFGIGIMYYPFTDGSSLYYPMNSEQVWNSVNPQGTVGLDENGASITSKGSFWWNMICF